MKYFNIVNEKYKIIGGGINDKSKDAPYGRHIDFGGSPYTKKEYENKLQSSEEAVKDIKALAAGTGAGVIASGVVHPLDTYLTSVMTKSPSDIQKFKKELGSLGPVGKIGRLYQGVGLKAIKVGIAGGLSFAAYNKIMRALNKEKK